MLQKTTRWSSEVCLRSKRRGGQGKHCRSRVAVRAMDLLELLRPQVAAVPASSVTSSRPPSVETGWRHAKSLRRLLQESCECWIDIAFTKIRDIFFGHLRMNKKRVTADVGGMRRDQQRRKADANVGFHDLLGHDAKVCRATLARKVLRTWRRGLGDPSDASTMLLHETPMWKVVQRGFFWVPEP